MWKFPGFPENVEIYGPTGTLLCRGRYFQKDKTSRALYLDVRNNSHCEPWSSGHLSIFE
jgi:hypothetical protein